MRPLVYQSFVQKRLYHFIVHFYAKNYSLACAFAELHSTAAKGNRYLTTTPTQSPSTQSPPPPPSSSSLPATVPNKIGGNNNNNNNNDMETDKQMELARDIALRGKSIMNAFFHETSKRSQRRQARLARWKARRRKTLATSNSDLNEKDNEQDEEEKWEDHRTIRELLFPHPYDMMDKSNQQAKEKRTLKFYFQAGKEAWEMYKGTWRGFWSSGVIVRDDPLEEMQAKEGKKSVKTSEVTTTVDNKDDDDDDGGGEMITPREAKRRLRRNVRRNAKGLRKTALRLREEVRERTGIRTADDFKRVLAETMQLISESLQEFLSGYREGRDGQVRQMLEEDLRQQQEEQAKAAAGGEENNKRKRRRHIKRRIVGR